MAHGEIYSVIYLLHVKITQLLARKTEVFVHPPLSDLQLINWINRSKVNRFSDVSADGRTRV